jgi:hypothetical protein
MILGALLVVRDVAGLFRKWLTEVNQARLKWVVLAILLGVTLSHENRNIRKFDLFNFGAGEIAHYNSCRWADQTMPSNSLVVSWQMSGALWFYTERPIVRLDWTWPHQWSAVKKRAAERGYQWYALLMPFEIEEAQKRLSGKWTKMGMVGPVSLWRIEPSSE